MECDLENQIFDLCLRELKKKGSVLLLPTETVYGLVCDWKDSAARKKIRKMKSREEAKPLQMLAPDIDSLVAYGVEITPAIKKIAGKFCPGPVTIVANLNKKEKDGMKTVGFRIPAYPFLLDLMKESGKLFAATSANIAGEPPCREVFEALDKLEEAPDLAVNAGKICGQASTVIDMTGKGFIILRPGKITEKDLLEMKLNT